jgi:hypothetical protein
MDNYSQNRRVKINAAFVPQAITIMAGQTNTKNIVYFNSWNGAIYAVESLEGKLQWYEILPDKEAEQGFWLYGKRAHDSHWQLVSGPISWQKANDLMEKNGGNYVSFLRNNQKIKGLLNEGEPHA